MNTQVASAQQVMFFQTTPEEVVRLAQVILITDSSWYIHGPFVANGKRSFCGVPSVTCPVVDLSDLPQSLDKAVGEILREHASGNQYSDLPTMLIELEKLGARVVRPVILPDLTALFDENQAVEMAK